MVVDDSSRRRADLLDSAMLNSQRSVTAREDDASRTSGFMRLYRCFLMKPYISSIITLGSISNR